MMAEKKKEPKMVGTIVFGGGLNEKQAIAEAKTNGFEVRIKEGYAELWK